MQSQLIGTIATTFRIVPLMFHVLYRLHDPNSVTIVAHAFLAVFKVVATLQDLDQSSRDNQI